MEAAAVPKRMLPGGPWWRGEPLRKGHPEEVTTSLSYAMRFDKHGKARRSGHEYAVGITARHLAAHLAWSDVVMIRKPPQNRNAYDV